MLKDFKTALIETIRAVDASITVREYRGELSAPETAKMLPQELPAVLVDFVRDDVRDEAHKTALFNLYFVHVAYTKNRGVRDTAKWELVDLLEAVDTVLLQARFRGVGKIRPTYGTKLFDGRTGSGYLSAFARTIEVSFWN